MATAAPKTEPTSDGPRLSLSGSNDGKWIINVTTPIVPGESLDGVYQIVSALVAKVKAEHGEKVAYSRGAPKASGAPAAARPAAGAPRPAAAASREPIFCEHCSAEIKGVTFKDGKEFSASQVAGWGRKLDGYNVALCSTDYQAAKKGTLVLSVGGVATDGGEDLPF